MGSWLPLTDYSIKYRVSVSTLRRRIKTEDLKFRFDDGKYFIIDEPPTTSTHQREHRPSQASETLVGTHNLAKKVIAPDMPYKQLGNYQAQTILKPETVKEIVKEDPILATANKLLTELKKAYTQILQEKEQQIFQLRNETADLRTLVKVLESENERLNAVKKRI